jgi:hypothetical protein
VIEVENRDELDALERDLKASFDDQCNLEPILKEK